MRVAAQAATVSDAGDPELAKRSAEYENYRMRRDAVYCDPKLEVVCSFEEPLYDYCDFDAVVAKTCEVSGEVAATKNTCGGLTLGASTFAGGLFWHYNDKFELIGANLSNHRPSYCGELSIKIGEECERTQETVTLCVKHDD